ncbi:hypothetical protein VTK73DRAFT_8054 [Phialemonium thermophilum]|uniref:Uncharacterized protein n=1 Tax=Phialemonium thermophilum TaxID=223376 RepID=A0ABR3XQ35_9PEZI
MQPISSVDVYCAPGSATCVFESLWSLRAECGEIVIPIGTEPHHVNVQPTAITITLTNPTPTSSCATTTTTTSTTTSTSVPEATYPAESTYGLKTRNPTGSDNQSPPSYCEKPLLDVVVDLLGLNIDITAYLNLSGLLDAVGDLLSGLLGGGKQPSHPHGGSSGGSDNGYPTSVTRHYRAHCGSSLENCNCGWKHHKDTAKDAQDCVQRCEKAAIKATVELGSLVDCLGVTLDHGLAVDNCLFVLGQGHDLLDVDVDLNLLNSNSRTDSLINIKID